MKAPSADEARKSVTSVTSRAIVHWKGCVLGARRTAGLLSCAGRSIMRVDMNEHNDTRRRLSSQRVVVLMPRERIRKGKKSLLPRSQGLSIVVLTSRCTGVVRCLKHMSQLLPYSGGHAVAPYSPAPGQQPEATRFPASVCRAAQTLAGLRGGRRRLHPLGLRRNAPDAEIVYDDGEPLGRPPRRREESERRRYRTARPKRPRLAERSPVGRDAGAARSSTGSCGGRDRAARPEDESPGSLLGRVSVKPVVNTALLNLSVSWKTPERIGSDRQRLCGRFRRPRAGFRSFRSRGRARIHLSGAAERAG